MLAFILRRLLWAIPVLFFVALVSFFLMHQAPGGPFDKDNNKKQVDGATLKALNARFGLDKPQYVNPGAVGEQWCDVDAQRAEREEQRDRHDDERADGCKHAGDGRRAGPVPLDGKGSFTFAATIVYP